MSNTHDPKRRSLLLGGLAAGCALCLGVAAAEKPGATGSGKTSKAKAKYQDKPNGKLKCANCNNFIAPDSCKVVEGKISPNGWCIFYVPKTG